MNIGFSSTNNFLGRIVRWATRIEANCAYFRFSLAGEEMVAHADYKSVKVDTWKEFRKGRNIVAEFVLKISKEEEDKLLSYVCAETSQEWWSIFAYLIVLKRSAFSMKVRSPIKGRAAFWFCEFALMAIRKTDLGWTKHLDREIVSPADLIEFLSLHPHVRKIC